MEKIIFSLEKYNTHEYDVVTRDDSRVRILCTDCLGSKPIISLAKYKTTEKIICSNIDGTFDWAIESNLDLFLVKKKWQPEHGHVMFYIDRNLDATWMVYNMFKNDCINLVKIGNCFETREDALYAIEKIKKAIE